MGHHQLRAEGWPVSCGRIARLMRGMGIASRLRPKWVATTDSKQNFPAAPNLSRTDLSTRIVAYSMCKLPHFSIATIDNFPSETNYVKFQGSEQRISRYSPQALFSTIDMQVFGKYIYILPATNDVLSPKSIDLYSSKNGKYLHSLNFQNKVVEFEISNNKLFTIEINEQENKTLLIYDLIKPTSN